MRGDLSIVFVSAREILFCLPLTTTVECLCYYPRPSTKHFDLQLVHTCMIVCNLTIVDVDVQYCECMQGRQNQSSWLLNVWPDQFWGFLSYI